MSAASIAPDELLALEAFALELARAAGEPALAHFREAITVDDKSGGAGYDPVTVADREAERRIRELIARRYPAHGILGEEHGHEPGSVPLTWVIDPIDGTRSYITGMLHWGVLVALNDGERPVLGVTHQPYTDEFFTGSANGAWLERGARRTRLATRACATLGDAVLCATHPEIFTTAPERQAFDALARQVRLMRYGGDCYSYCLLAHGLVDLVVESSLKAYDVQALIPLVEAAGGVFTDWRGGPAHDGGQVLAASDPRLHAAALEVLAKG